MSLWIAGNRNSGRNAMIVGPGADYQMMLLCLQNGRAPKIPGTQ